MKFYAFLAAALIAAAQAKNVLQSQDASQASQAKDIVQKKGLSTPKPTVKYLDISEGLATKYPMPTGNVTIKPTRPDPRETEPPTPASTLPSTPAPTPAPTPPPAPWVTVTINHNEVKPFPQPEPVTISEKAAVKFKPQIRIGSGCVPYPVVNDKGETSGGVQTSGNPSGGCRGSGHGSQVYGRAGWHNDAWAIMYSWYFPKDSPSSRMGHRHDWEHVVVWINNPD
ncbi:hypothetical protein PR003_g14472 [Phytophthora rubi]|uniref:Uncharacterized protein n=2 Tax=Phytophthora TaxID=4783 RepID=A0A6A4FC74_9STRA|nr:hypothetical protein PR002_g13877 [Phytophthora rubi]KAE9332521.1 hypothetical protein PR003_g14472 [Phytophthora rubi]